MLYVVRSRKPRLLTQAFCVLYSVVSLYHSSAYPCCVTKVLCAIHCSGLVVPLTTGTPAIVVWSRFCVLYSGVSSYHWYTYLCCVAKVLCAVHCGGLVPPEHLSLLTGRSSMCRTLWWPHISGTPTCVVWPKVCVSYTEVASYHCNA